jgi:hypothetical protein
MKRIQFIATAVCVLAGAVAYQAVGGNQAAQSRPIMYEYGTLTSQAIQEPGGMVYTVTWNLGQTEQIGRSTTSMIDARRRLLSQLGGAGNVRTTLSALLTRLGNDGWRLIETNQDDFGLTSVLIRTVEQ